MSTYKIFIDESGSAKPDTFAISPYFSLCGVMITEQHGEQLDRDLGDIKLKYFGRKNFILHAADLRYHLKSRGKSLEDFSKDLKKILNKCYFFLLYVVVNKEKASKLGWDIVAVHDRTYKILLSNMLKFLVAKNVKGEIFAEASNWGQDQFLYKAFAHLIRSGISRVSISNIDVKQRLTSLCFVTKLNNDSEEQLSDLFGVFARLEMELNRGIRTSDSLDYFERVIYEIGKKRLFVSGKNLNKVKEKLYKEINSFKILP